METKISVVVTTWGKDPRACIESVRAQDVPLEIIKIENGNGASAARNEGAACAKGEYIIFVDADCMLMPNILAKMKDVLDNHPDITFVYGNHRRTGAWKKVFTSQEFHPPPFDLLELCKMNYIPTTALVRRDSIPAWDESIKRLNDWDFWLTIALAGGKGYYLNEMVFTAHYSDNDISLKGHDDYVMWYKRVARKHRELLEGMPGE